MFLCGYTPARVDGVPVVPYRKLQRGTTSVDSPVDVQRPIAKPGIKTSARTLRLIPASWQGGQIKQPDTGRSTNSASSRTSGANSCRSAGSPSWLLFLRPQRTSSGAPATPSSRTPEAVREELRLAETRLRRAKDEHNALGLLWYSGTPEAKEQMERRQIQLAEHIQAHKEVLLELRAETEALGPGKTLRPARKAEQQKQLPEEYHICFSQVYKEAMRELA